MKSILLSIFTITLLLSNQGLGNSISSPSFTELNFDSCEVLKPVPQIEKRKPDKFIFDPDTLNRLACRARLRLMHLKNTYKVDQNKAVKIAINYLEKELKDHYPKHIELGGRWLFNIAGGGLFQVKIKSCSLKEYLILFQSPIGTSGYSGKYKAELWDFVIDGGITDYKLGEFKAHHYKPLDHTYMRPGDSQGFKADANTLVMEYARGKVMSAVKFGVLANRKNLGSKETYLQIKECANRVLSSGKLKKKLRRLKREF